jgi:hypothetical protein
MNWFRREKREHMNRDNATLEMIDKVMKQLPSTARNVKVKVAWESLEEGDDDCSEYTIVPNIEVAFDNEKKES